MAARPTVTTRRPRLAFQRAWLWTAVLTVLALGAVAYSVGPMLLVLAGSLTSEPQKIFSYWDPLSLRAFVPPGLTTASYSGVIDGSFGTAMVNSLIVATATVVVGLVMSIMAAFALAVLRFRFREAVFALVVVSFLIPFDAVSIPLSGTFRAWGLSNSLVGLILPGLANGLAVFLLRQFFLGIPQELTDAARIDGMTNRQMIQFVFLPLARAPIIGAGLLLFLAQWQEYLWPLLTITDTSKEVAPVALGEFVTQFSTDFRGMFAAAVLTTALPMVLVLMLQRYFTQTVVGTEGK
jgi:putative chitobiose transport system permease protein